MRYIITIAIIIKISFCFSQNEIQNRIFSSIELKQDFDLLFNQLEEIHVDLYYYTPKTKIDSLRKKVYAELNTPMSRKDFALKIKPVVAALQDGHTGVLLPREERLKYFENKGTLFPFSVRIYKNKIYITQNLSSDSTIHINSQIVSINGIEADVILNKMRNFIPAEIKHFRDIRIENDFRRLLWYLYGFEKGYSLELMDNEELFETKVEGINIDRFNEVVAKKNTSFVQAPFSFYQYKDKSIGVLDLKSMANKNNFKEFLDSVFTVIKNDSIQNLVIDIRQNGGGDSRLAEMLFNYISDKPYKMTEQVKMKISKTAKKYGRRNVKWFLYPIAYPIVLFIPAAKPYFYGSNGAIKTIKYTKMRQPKKEPLRFYGKTYLLTSHYTFSSATMLANVFKCFEMGTIIGEETGGAPSSFGDITVFHLTNTQLMITCSHKKFLDVCDDNQVNGVLPDIEIKNENGKLGHDAAIEYIKQLPTINNRQY